jgi:hypothetical protein
MEEKMKRMFHQKVEQVLFYPKFLGQKEFLTLQKYDRDISKLIKSIAEFIYNTDNIYLLANIRKIYQYHSQIYPEDSFDYFLQTLKNLNTDKMINITFLEDVLYSTVAINPKLMLLYYSNYIPEFEKLLEAIIFEIKEKDNRDSYKIALNVKAKLVVVNNIFDYMREMGILVLMRYSGTPLPGGKSFIILKKDQEKLEKFLEIYNKNVS